MAGPVSMRGRPRFLFSNPRDMACNSLMREQAVARGKILGQHAFIRNQIVNAAVAETAHIQAAAPELVLAITLDEPTNPMHAPRNEMMKRQRDRAAAQFARGGNR